MTVRQYAAVDCIVMNSASVVNSVFSLFVMPASMQNPGIKGSIVPLDSLMNTKLVDSVFRAYAINA